MFRHPSRVMPGLKENGFEEESEESEADEIDPVGPNPFCGPRRFRERRDCEDDQGNDGGGLCY